MRSPLFRGQRSHRLTMAKVAVVTGSNKGIGFAIVKGLLTRFDGVVYLTSRDESRGKAAVAKLKELGLHPEYHQLDVSSRDSVVKFRDHIKQKHGGLDVLVNNAAIANSESLYNSYQECKNIVDINYYSLLTIQEFLFPLLRGNARVLNISSDCGHLSNIKNQYWIERLSRKDLKLSDVNEFVSWFLEGVKNGTFDYNEIADEGTVAAYRIAKVGVSAVTMLQQKEVEPRGISVNSLHPGLVRTDMTLGAGFFSAEQAAETPLYVVLDAPHTLRGAYVWYDKRVLDWYDHKADYYFKTNTLKKD